MINPYRTLTENLPERVAVSRDATPVDPKRLSLWVEGLPRANQDVYLQKLARLLNELRTRRLEGFTRLDALEVLRPALLEATALLTTRLQGSSFPLTGVRAENATKLMGLQRELALGYRLAVVEACAPTGKVPFLRGAPVTLALVRAMYHHLRWLATCHLLYRSPEPGVWAQIHALAAFAADHKLDNKPVDDAAERRPLAVGRLRNQAVLMSLASPYRFNQRELAELWTLTRDVAGLIEVTPERFAAAGALLLIDTDSPPAYVSRAPRPEEGDALWVDLRKLDGLMRASLSHAGSGSDALMKLSRDVQLSVPVDMLERALEGWGQDASRAFPRLDGGYTLDSVVGLTALHYQLAGQRDFAAFIRNVRGISEMAGERATWGQATSDATPPGSVPVQVQDQSLNGYRLRWLAEHAVRVRIGELVGVALPIEEMERDWIVGTVRWLRYDESGAIEAGVDLIARRAAAVGLRGMDASGGVREPVRGLRLTAMEHLPGKPKPEMFLVQGLTDLQASQVEVVRTGDRWDSEESGHVKVYTCPTLRTQRRAGDYLLVAAQD